MLHGGHGEVQTCSKHQTGQTGLLYDSIRIFSQHPQQNTARLHCKGVPRFVYHALLKNAACGR